MIPVPNETTDDIALAELADRVDVDEVRHAIALVSHRPSEIFDPWPVGAGSWRRPTAVDDERWARGGRRVLRVWCMVDVGAV